MHASVPSEKYMAPSLPPTILHRTSLVTTLVEASAGAEQGSIQTISWCSLILLCAPAGYGKTTLLADFARTSMLTCCWLHLDETDTEPLSFLALLLASIRHRFPQFGSSLDAQLTYSESNPEALLRRYHTFIDTLSSSITQEIDTRLALILCNYELVNSKPEIAELLEYLLEKLPKQCITIVESRAMPKFNFARLIARRQVIRLDIDHLRFTAPQIHALTQLLLPAPLSMDEAEKIAITYEGWITGILLGTHLSFIPQIPSQAARTSATNESRQQFLFAYLASEVFQQREETYIFLRDLAILSHMQTDICDELLSIKDSSRRLADIEQQGLFVTHVEDAKQTIYLCHPTLRELLLKDLSLQDPERLKELQQHAARIFAAQHENEKAITHAIAASDYTYAADLISDSARLILRKGYSERLLSWIDALPPILLEQNATLLLTRAKIYLLRYELPKAELLIDKALAQMEIPTNTVTDLPPEQANLLADIYITKGTFFFRTGDHLAAQSSCQLALERVSMNESELRAQAYQLLGACDCLQGYYQIGITHLQQAFHLSGRYAGTRQKTLLHTYLANAYSMIGNYALSEHHRERSIQGFELINDMWGKTHNLIGIGTTQQLKGLPDEAEKSIQQALQLARETQDVNGEGYALINLSEIYQDRGNYKQALISAEDGLQCAENTHDIFLTSSLHYSLALSYLYMGDTNSASLYIEKVREIAEGNSSVHELYMLVQGMILFWQQKYAQALEILSRLDTSLAATDSKHVHMRTMIYIAACQFAQGERQHMERSIERLAALIKQIDSAYLALVELGRLPELTHAIRTLPAIRFLWHNAQQSPTTTKKAQKPSAGQTVHVASAHMHILAFGDPTVLLDEGAITHWRMARSMELFFFLLDAHRPVHKELIMTALWPEGDEHLEQNMRTIVFHLRRTIGEQCVLFRAGTYRLELASTYGENISYDVALFQKYAQQAKDLQDTDLSTAINHLHRMVDLYTGDYVQSFYHDWSNTRRQHLRNQYLDARQQLAQYYAEKDQPEESLIHWQHILALDKFHEQAHEGVIQCYLKQRRRDSALRQYRQCADVLHNELGISPGPSLRQLYQRLTTSV